MGSHESDVIETDSSIGGIHVVAVEPELYRN